MELRFVDDKAGVIDSVRQLAAVGARTIRVEPAAAAGDLIGALGVGPESPLRFLSTGAMDADGPAGLVQVAADAEVDAVAIASSDAEIVSSALMTCVDLRRGTVIAPLTDDHSSRRCLFLISIPKAGTHLLYRLAELFGYHPGIICPDDPAPQHWYCVEYSNSHTSARDFFIDSVRRSPFGNKDHPFMRSAAVFIYRDPRDILVSEANWYHRSDASPFHGYLEHLPFRERLLLLMEDPWLLGSIRDRVAAFAPWLDLPNVIPVSFEELVGAAGGGDIDEQWQAIWSLQLKLQVAGTPRTFAGRLFDRASPTFNEGRIGGWRACFDDEVSARFSRLPQDFMRRFGYGSDDGSGSLPVHRQPYRHRPLIVERSSFAEVPYLIEADFSGFNIVGFRRAFFAVPITRGAVDLVALPESELRALPNHRDLAALREKITRSGDINAAGQAGQSEIPMPDQPLSRLRAIEDTLDERDGRLLGLKTTLQELQQRLRSLEGTIAECDNRIHSLEGAVEERDTRLAILDGAFGERSRRLQTLEREAALREQRVERLEQTLDERTRRLERIEQTLERESALREQRVERLEQTLDERTQRLAGVEKAIEERRAGLVALEAAFGEQLTDLRMGVKKGLHATAILEESIQAVDEQITDLRVILLEAAPHSPLVLEN